MHYNLPVTAKERKLKPSVIECVERLRKFVDLDAPGVIIGREAWNVLLTVFACYGEAAGKGMIHDLRDSNLHGRGVCTHADCVNYVERPGVNVCAACAKEMGAEV